MVSWGLGWSQTPVQTSKSVFTCIKPVQERFTPLRPERKHLNRTMRARKHPPQPGSAAAETLPAVLSFYSVPASAACPAASQAVVQMLTGHGPEPRALMLLVPKQEHLQGFCISTCVVSWKMNRSPFSYRAKIDHLTSKTCFIWYIRLAKMFISLFLSIFKLCCPSFQLKNKTEYQTVHIKPTVTIISYIHLQ